jgi:hypothetical protein
VILSAISPHQELRAAFEAGDFWEILAKVANLESLETGGTYANMPQIAEVSRRN